MICAIVLSAGESRRMGSHKQLLPFASSTVISHIVDQLLVCNINEVFVVTGHNREQISEELSNRNVTVINNPDYKMGMLSSVRSGLRALPESCAAVMVVLGDQPSINSEIVEKMIEAFMKSDKGILVPVFDDARGHPIILDAHYKDEVLASFEDVGLRGLLYKYSEDIMQLEFHSDDVLRDMDYPEDYQREIARHKESED